MSTELPPLPKPRHIFESNEAGELPRFTNSEVRAYAAAAVAAAVPQWQPIETAPRDQLVDIWTETSRRYADCYWDAICGEWRHIDHSGTLIRLRHATHWMLPPAAPEVPR